MANRKCGASLLRSWQRARQRTPTSFRTCPRSSRWRLLRFGKWCPTAFGNLWAFGYTDVNFVACKVCKYAAADVLQSGTPTPVLTLTLSAPVDPNGGGNNSGSILFDKANNLWLLTGHGGTFGTCQLQRYRQASLLSTSTPTPDVAITCYNAGSVAGGPSSGGNTFFGAFDSNGALWIGVGFAGLSAVGGGGGILMLSRDQLEVSNAALVPSVYWFGANFPNAGTENISWPEFGPTGLLWTSAASQNKIQAWNASAPSSGNQAPVITLTSATFNHPIGLTFDAAGNLWAANESDGKIFRIPKASLGASGAVVPDVILTPPAIAFSNGLTFAGNPNRCGFVATGLA